MTSLNIQWQETVRGGQRRGETGGRGGAQKVVGVEADILYYTLCEWFLYTAERTCCGQRSTKYGVSYCGQ